MQDRKNQPRMGLAKNENPNQGSFIAQPQVTSVIIIGAKRPEQRADNIAATKTTLSADELKQLDEVSRLPSEYLDGCTSDKANTGASRSARVRVRAALKPVALSVQRFDRRVGIRRSDFQQARAGPVGRVGCRCQF
ncbi:MAG: hypothetical protein ABJA83_12975 [Burkholderiaceae bacterium]